MSLKLMDKAFDIRVGNPLRKLILVKLADNASDLGECWPSYQHIADQCEISKRSVMSHIDALCEMGLIRKECRTGPKGNSSNLYHLTLDGAGVSPGGSEGRSPHSAAHSPGGAGVSPGGSEGAAPRISHSFEPVKESVNEPKDIGAQAEARTPAKRSSQEYSPEFETAWQTYPKRAGSSNKQQAWKAWRARLKEGVTPESMQAGVSRYATYIAATGNVGTQYVKQAATFFGPDRHFDDAYEPPAQAARHIQAQARHTGFQNVDYGKTQKPSWAKGAQ